MNVAGPAIDFYNKTGGDGSKLKGADLTRFATQFEAQRKYESDEASKEDKRIQRLKDVAEIRKMEAETNEKAAATVGNSIVANYASGGSVPIATAPAPATPATQTPAPTISVGGQTLDPNNPAYANLIAKAQAAQQPAATTPTQPTAPATTTPAGPVAAPQAAQAVNTNQLQAGPVALGGAPAVMLAGDFNAALSGLKLNTNHIKELKDKIAQDASFKNAFLKALGLAK
jgi:hypothetical protein